MTTQNQLELTDTRKGQLVGLSDALEELSPPYCAPLGINLEKYEEVTEIAYGDGSPAGG